MIEYEAMITKLIQSVLPMSGRLQPTGGRQADERSLPGDVRHVPHGPKGLA